MRTRAQGSTLLHGRFQPAFRASALGYRVCRDALPLLASDERLYDETSL
jgi:hypothetical protein